MNASDPAKSSVVVLPNEVRVIRAFGAELHFHLTGEQTEKRFLLATIISPPGDGPPPHYHLNEDESFLVQEGRLSFLSDGKWTEVGPGTVVFTPRGTIHTYKNIGDTPARMLLTASPSGFDVFFERCSVEFAKPGGPDMEQIFKISAEHGIYYV